MNRRTRCERVGERLPGLVADELPRWRRRLVEHHLDRCSTCSIEAARQRNVAAQLARVSEVADLAFADVEAPDDLLASLLEQAREPGLRERAAVPARGAISGARPELTAAFAATILAMLATAIWAGWRLGRWWSDRD